MGKIQELTINDGTIYALPKGTNILSAYNDFGTNYVAYIEPENKATLEHYTFYIRKPNQKVPDNVIFLDTFPFGSIRLLYFYEVK